MYRMDAPNTPRAQHKTARNGGGGVARIAAKSTNTGKAGALKAAAKSIPSCVFITQNVRSGARKWERGSRL